MSHEISADELEDPIRVRDKIAYDDAEGLCK